MQSPSVGLRHDPSLHAERGVGKRGLESKSKHWFTTSSSKGAGKPALESNSKHTFTTCILLRRCRKARLVLCAVCSNTKVQQTPLVKDTPPLPPTPLKPQTTLPFKPMSDTCSQEWWVNFVLQGQLSVLTYFGIHSVPVLPQ